MLLARIMHARSAGDLWAEEGGRMPSGATHDRIAVVASPLLAAGATGVGLWLGQAPLAALMGGALLTASHLACSQWLSPDLDLGSSEIDERWGMLAPIWRPYERAIPHRHWLSHSGLSALLRLAYLFVALNVILLGVGLIVLLQGAAIGLFIADLPGSRMVWAWLWAQYLAVSTAGLALVLAQPAAALAIMAGALAADLLHTVADLIDTRRKRMGLKLELPDLAPGRLRLPAIPLLGLRRRRARPRRRGARAVG
jgi:uncharacterized metal-binding protein